MKSNKQSAPEAHSDYLDAIDKKIDAGKKYIALLFFFEIAFIIIFGAITKGLNFLSLALYIVFFVLLYKGKTVFRYILGIVFIFRVFADLYTLLMGDFSAYSNKTVVLILLAVWMAFHILSAIVLLLSKNIEEYLYWRNNG